MIAYTGMGKTKNVAFLLPNIQDIAYVKSKPATAGAP